MNKDYNDNEWVRENAWKWGKDDQRGAMNMLTDESVLRAFSMIKKGRIYDLETERFKGMPVWPGHCGFEVVSYASPLGRMNMKETGADPSISWYDQGKWLDKEHNIPEYNMGLHSEMLIGPMHVGTHIDALCHFTTGADNHMYNGFRADECDTNFGPAKLDAAKIPPIVTRGVLLDIAGFKGIDHLEDGYIISAEDCEACAVWEGVTLKSGDAVLLRLGESWPEGRCGSAGVGISAARYLVEECGAILLGDDMACIDGFHKDGSSSVDGHPQPVHHYLLIQQGIHIIEYLQLDKIAADKIYEFCLICLPAKVRYATGMMLRPVAVI